MRNRAHRSVPRGTTRGAFNELVPRRIKPTDAPHSDWLEQALYAFRLERRAVKALYDEHERTIAEDSTRLLKVIVGSE
jgi:hypothetical protein